MPHSSLCIASLIGAVFALPPGAQAATQPYTVTSFDSIRVDAPVRVLVTTGGGASAKGEGDRDALDRLDLQVSGGLLTIRMKPSQNGERRRAAGPLTLRLSTGAVRRVQLSGGGSLAIDRMKGLRGDLSLGGGGDISVGAVALDRIGVMLSGGGRVTLAGAAGDADLRIVGPGALLAEGLKAKQAKIVNDGSGSIAVTVATAADVRASGSGDVSVLGGAACKVVHAGAGRVMCGGEEY